MKCIVQGKPRDPQNPNSLGTPRLGWLHLGKLSTDLPTAFPPHCLLPGVTGQSITTCPHKICQRRKLPNLCTHVTHAHICVHVSRCKDLHIQA